MIVEAAIRLRNEPFIKAPLIGTALVAAHQQNGLPLGSKAKRDAPDAALPG
ncbi:MAG: hypothetical protein IPK02_20440 [Candidatus Accumulibacter sp.]|uniref:Uncharacterized protein n=1 Tax=Candidatus Accumulibacter affinis TaxID=2954384 RepID=A0A935TH08_9PROT|nr:hypothetical protein [Candidatus Accumulibacter affinis]